MNAEAIAYLESDEYRYSIRSTSARRRIIEVLDEASCGEDPYTCVCAPLPTTPLASVEWGPVEEEVWLKHGFIPRMSGSKVELHRAYYAENGNTLEF